jgi:hypothetical protein
MTTGNTTLLGLALPVEGELDGTWGDVVNDSITSLVDSAVAGTTTLSVDADVTLTTTVLAANQARQAILRWTASNGATTRNITAPAQSKPYIVINAGTGSIVLRGAGPTTGITIVAGERCVAAWSGSDFVKVATSATATGTVTSVGGTGTVNGITLSGTVTSTGNLTLGGALTGVNLATQVTGILPIANGGTGQTTQQAALNALSGAQTANRVLRSNGTNVSLSQVALTTDVTGTLPVANGGTGATTLTANNVLLGNGTSALQVVAPGTTGNLLTSNGTTWTSSAPAVTLAGSQTFTNKTISGADNTLTVDGTNAVGYRNIPPVGTKTSSYTLAVGDVGEYVQVGSGGSITIPNATFAEGDVVSIFNNTTGSITITCTISTAYVAGVNTDSSSMTLVSRGVATVLFISSTVCVVSGNVS